MTKSEFMRELASLLSRIPEDERNDAVQYYEDYFADAGITDEMLVPNSVGTPRQVADKIISEAIYGKHPEQMTEALKDVPATKSDKVKKSYYRQNESSNQSDYYDGNTNTKSNHGTYYDSNVNAGNNNSTYSTVGNNTDNTKLIVGIVIIIVTSPIWIGLVAGIGGILFGILAALAGIILGFGAAGIALMITAFLSSSVAGGILLVGTGMLLLALAIVLVIPLVLFCGRFLPWLVREMVNLVKRLFGKRGYAS